MALRSLSSLTTEALTILGTAIRAARLQRGWSINDLAERVGVSHVTILKAERGDPGVAIGTVFESANLVGVPLFDADPQERLRYGAQKRAELALLPSRARTTRPVDDDF